MRMQIYPTQRNKNFLPTYGKVKRNGKAPSPALPELNFDREGIYMSHLTSLESEGAHQDP